MVSDNNVTKTFCYKGHAVTYRSRGKRAHAIKSFESLPNATAETERSDPKETPKDDDGQQQEKQKSAVIGSGKTISPKELQKEEEIISKRDDAHRLVGVTGSPSTR